MGGLAGFVNGEVLIPVPEEHNSDSDSVEQAVRGDPYGD